MNQPVVEVVEAVEVAVDELAARRHFTMVVVPHLAALQARARQLCRAGYDPDDIVQETLVRAFLTRSQIQDPARARWWLLRILTRTFIDATRRQRRRPHHVELIAEVAEPTPAEPSPWAHIGVDELRDAVARLPDDVRATYTMFALEGRNYADVADAQQIPAATVGSRVFRARKLLRAMLTVREAAS